MAANWRRWAVVAGVCLAGCSPLPLGGLIDPPTPVVLPILYPSPTPSAEEHYLTAEALFAAGQYDQAALFYRFAIQTDPYLIRAYTRLGLAYENLGDMESALGIYSVAIQLAPYQPENYFLRGLAYKKQGLTPQAIANFRRFLDLSDNDIQRAIAENHLRELGLDVP